MSRRGGPLAIGRPDVPELRHGAVSTGVRRRRVHDCDTRVCTRQTDRLSARGIDRGHKPRVDRSGEHLHDDRQRGLVGHTHAVDLPLPDAGARQGGIDLAPAAVYDDERDDRRRAGDRRCQRAHAARLLHQLASELQHPPAAAHTSNPARSSNPNAMLKPCTA